MGYAYGGSVNGYWPFGSATSGDPFDIILDVAESSSFGLGSGNPTIPVTMYVQYVRVYAGQSPSGGTGNLKNTSTYGQSVTLTAMLSVIPPGKNATPTGIVTFEDNGRVLGTASLINGQMATLATTGLSVGVNSIQAIYSGDTNFTGQLTWTGAEQEITPLDYNPNACTTSSYSGLSEQVDDLPIIDTTISGYPLVDMNQVDSLSAAVTQTVSKAASSTTTVVQNSVTTKNETFTATVAGAYGGSATGTVTFYDGSTVLGTGTVNAANNQATCSTTILPAGTYAITAIYSGDSNLPGSSSSSVTQTVYSAATTVTLTSSTQTQVFGQSVTFTATVSAVAGAGAGPPTGIVTFEDGSSSLGTGLLNSTSVASFTTYTLPAGTHTIMAVYSGDSSFNSSTGTLPGGLTITQTVGTATTYTRVSSSPATSVFGQSVTFTATVTATGFDDGGWVQFTVDGNTTGSTLALNSSGQATLSVSTLSAGIHSITAIYAGDTTFSDSNGQTTQTVNQATSTISWAMPAAISYGTTLSSTQLNATGSVAGTMAYSPVSGTVLSIGASQALQVIFMPADSTDYTTATDTVSITVNQATSTITWATPAPITYGTALSGTQLNATGSVSGTMAYNPAAGTVLGPGVSQVLQVTFTPTDATDYTTATATVSINVNKAAPTITWAAPAPIIFGTVLSNTQLNATGSVSGTTAYSPAVGAVLSAGASQALQVTFTPTDTVDNTTATAMVSITVNKAAPTITWAAPVAISYGTALSSTQLDATGSVAGTTAYSPAVGTVLSAGPSQALQVTFTPADTVDYTTAMDTVYINVVSKTIPTITWATPTAITYGMALSATQLNATGSVSGTMAYNPVSGTVLSAGANQALQVTFTPTDTTDYTTATATVYITVNRALPAITWATPAAITYGTALSYTQLNAATVVSGTIVYNPVSGTVLDAGASQALQVTFTPTDTVDYTTATAMVHITVSQALTTITLGNVVNPSVYGASVTFTATVTAGTETFDNGGTVQFAVDERNYGSPVSLSGGRATIAEASLSGGTHTITASYSGDTDFSASSGTLSGGQTVTTTGTTTVLSSTTPSSVFGQSVTFTATVNSANDGTLTGTVTFCDGSVTLATATPNGSGLAMVSIGTLSAGVHTLSAIYATDGTYAESTSAVLYQMVAPSATMNIASTVAAAGSTIYVPVELNQSDYLDAAGLAITFNASRLQVLAVNRGSLTSSFDGFVPNVSNSAGTIRITLWRTAGAIFGQGSGSLATIEFQVSSSAPLGATIINLMQNIGSTATSLHASDAAGNDLGYFGLQPAPSNAAGDSLDGCIVVEYGTTTAVVSSGNPSMFGQSVIFTATVMSQSGVPTGTVTFEDGGTLIGTSTLTPLPGGEGQGGVATYATSSLTAGSHTITAVYAGDGSYMAGTSSTLTQTVNPGTLSVISFTPTPTGFQAVFNGLLNTSVLTLADVTLTGSSTGPINGSLVVDQVDGASRITFIVSGETDVGSSPLVHGILPNDTYTVTLVSAGNGFKDSDGDLLNDGVSYSSTFTVDNQASALIVSLPDFARGPGQVVNVPNGVTSSGIPLRVDNTGGSAVSVTAITLDLVYNPALLTITGGSVAAGMPTSATVTVDTTTVPGTAVIDFASTTPVLVNPGAAATFVGLTATVPTGATYGSKEILDLQGLHINNSSTGVIADDAIHAVGYAGDATMEFNYTVEDAMDVARVAIDLDSGFTAWPLLDPVVLADVAGNGMVEATDAMYIARYALGIPVAQMPALPSVVTPGMSGPDPILSIGNSVQMAGQNGDRHLEGSEPVPILAGSVVQVPVMLNHSDGLTAINLAIAYDTSRLTVSAADIQRGSLTDGFDSFTVTVDAAAGIIRIEGYRSAGPLTGLGSGSVALIDFHVKDSAPAGAAAINLLQNAGTTWTSVAGMDGQGNDYLFDLEPRPSNTAGGALDGCIEVLASAGLPGGPANASFSQFQDNAGLTKSPGDGTAVIIQPVAVKAGNALAEVLGADAANEAAGRLPLLSGSLLGSVLNNAGPDQVAADAGLLPAQVVDDVFAHLGEAQDRDQTIDFDSVQQHLADDSTTALFDNGFAAECSLISLRSHWPRSAH